MSRTIDESGMRFGPFDDDAFFSIEASSIRAALGPGIKAPEFVWLKHESPAALWFVEAKSSSPQPNHIPDFDKFLDEIAQKFIHGLTLFVAACLDRHADPTVELSPRLRAVNLGGAKIRLILVINGHDKAWLPPLQDALRKVLEVDRRVWGLDSSAVVVLNHVMAATRGLVAPIPP